MQFVDKIGVIRDDPFGKVKSLITDLINRVQSENGVMKFGASADKDQFARVKTVITDLITWLPVESLSGISHKSYCDEEMHKHVMRSTVQAEARQPYSRSKQQPAKKKAQDREREEIKKENGGQVEEEKDKEVDEDVTVWVQVRRKTRRRVVQEGKSVTSRREVSAVVTCT